MLTLRANIGILAWKASINLKVQIRLGISGHFHYLVRFMMNLWDWLRINWVIDYRHTTTLTTYCHYLNGVNLAWFHFKLKPTDLVASTFFKAFFYFFLLLTVSLFLNKTTRIYPHPLTAVCHSPHTSLASSHSLSLPVTVHTGMQEHTHTHTRTRAHTSFFLPLTFSPGQMQALLPLSATFEVTSSWWLMIWWWNMSVGSPLASRIHRCAGAGRVRISVWGSCFLPTLTFKAQDKDAAVSHSTLAAAAICCVPDNLSLEHFWPPPRKSWIATQSQTFYL